MLAISGDIQIFVLQSGVVLRRLRGVSGRFESGDAGLDAGVAMYALAILAGVLTVLVTRRAVVWYRVLRLLGPEGLGLDKESVTLWWGYLSPVLRQDPARLLSSRERMAAELERLADAGEDALAREVHKAWIEHTPAAQNPRNGLKNLVQTEAIRVRDHKTGRRIFEGYLRRVGQDAVDVVPFKKVGMERMSEGSGHVYLIRARGCGKVLARVLRVAGDGKSWTFSVGEAAKVAHQRLEFRLRADLGALLFDKRLGTLKEIQEDMRGEGPVRHYLIEKQRRENKPTYTILMERKRVFSCSRFCRLIDLSALGARIRMSAEDDLLPVGRKVYLYLPVEISGRNEEQLIRAEAVEAWSEPHEGEESMTRIVRLRFFDLEDSEIQELRTFANRLDAGSEENTVSHAHALHEQYCFNPVD